ncbi:MAG: CDF family Co(II)/Ni(II) efflux transporter DmeF [Methylococcaceae bacterium]
MHEQSLSQLRHTHDFVFLNKKGERRTKQVVALTFITMLLEISAGLFYGSMALLADGWHMATHVAAFMIALFTYRYARKHATDNTFSFGSGKVGVLGGFTSAIILGMVALLMLIESGQRLANPQLIHFDEAIIVAVLGLVVNLLSALLLKNSHSPHHEHNHHDTHHHHHHEHDHNLKAAYLHVLADALTSVLAIIALLSGKYFSLNWLDPAMGVLGGLIIIKWSQGLLTETSSLLLDQSIDANYLHAIKETIESDADNRIADIHIWRVAPNHFALIISLVSHHPQSPDYYKTLLKDFDKLKHITIEVNQCLGVGCL